MFYLNLVCMLMLASASRAEFRQFQTLGETAAPSQGTFRLRYNSEPPSLNPIVAEGYPSVEIQFYVIEALLLQNEDTYEWQPWLADQWRVAADGRSYDFHLRQNALWSDGK